MPTYHVTVGSFDGPFDLLLQLVARRKVDVCDLPLAQITDEYLTVAARAGQLDLEVASGFLVVAATLLELKAARLLPDEHDPELEDLAWEARDLLYARLLEYRTFKRAAGKLADRLSAHSGFVPRRVPLERRFAEAAPDADLRVSADGLARLAARALAPPAAEEVDLGHLQPPRLSVREAAGIVLLRLRGRERVSFAELVAGYERRADLVVCFLALLELYRAGQVQLEQARSFGELSVRAVDDPPEWDVAGLDEPAARAGVRGGTMTARAGTGGGS